MVKQPKLIILGLLILLTAGGILYVELGQTPIPENYPDNNTVVRNPGIRPEKEIALRQKNSDQKQAKTRFRELLDSTRANIPSAEKTIARAPVNSPKYIEEIKQQIYERNIESIEQLPLLDALVQTGDKDTREFWGDGWTSVDDWKTDSNGFKLEKSDAGALVFTPDEKTASQYTFFENPLAYTYDAENREFVNEVDYYGKTIYNVAKFINDDVLVMMTISGRKVDLNIYQKNAGQESATDAPILPDTGE